MKQEIDLNLIALSDEELRRVAASIERERERRKCEKRQDALEAKKRYPLGYTLDVKPGDYYGSMGNLGWLARQYKAALRMIIEYKERLKTKEGRLLAKIASFYDRLIEEREMPLGSRLFLLTDEAVDYLGRHGVFRISGWNPPLKPARSMVRVNPNSDFSVFYHPETPLEIWDLCPDGDPNRPGLHLIAIESPYEGKTPRRGRDLECWAIGWVTDPEYQELLSSEQR